MGDYLVKQEKIHGNKYVYIHSKEGTTSPIEIIINFDVNRQEHENIEYNNTNPANYLDSYLMVSTGEIFSRIITKNNFSSNNIRSIYDYVLNGMHYGYPKDTTTDDQYYSGKNPKTNQKWLPYNNKYGLKEVSIEDVVSLYKESKSTDGNYTFGNGNSIYACDIGVGNCTDYHSYFMSLNRTIGIPSRFHMGFPIPSASEGKITGYHCWADYYIVERWLGGTLTNFITIKKSIKRLLALEKESSAIYQNITKKETVMLQREKLKLSDLHRGIKNMKRIPTAIFIVDGIHEIIAIKEAKKLDIPTFGIIDSNTDPNIVDFPIPANDDSVKCIRLMMDYIIEKMNDASGRSKDDTKEAIDESENKESIKP